MMIKHARRRSGFSLVLTLIVLALLSISVVGFISSSTLDKATAHAAANKTQAELAAQGAVNRAINMVSQTITRYPDSATTWEKLEFTDKGLPVEGTMLYYADKDPDALDANRYILPLISTGGDDRLQPGTPKPLKEKKETLGPDAWTNTNSVDFNKRRFNGDEEGWVGAAPEGRQPLRAKWVNVLKDSAQRSKPEKEQEVTSRYAFWVEDESFRLNLNELGPTVRGANTLGHLPQDIPYQGLLKSARIPNGAVDPSGFASRVFQARSDFIGGRLPELRSFNEVEPNFLVADKTKFLSTVYSGGLNISRNGYQRVDLNGLNFDKVEPSVAEVEKGINQVVESIKANAPRFGQRLYRTSSSVSPAILNKEEVSKQQQKIYMTKVAANIRDYIDPDLFPTMVKNTGKLAERQVPAHAFSSEDGENEMWAQGKDSAPYMQETLQRFRGQIQGNTFDLKVDYYIEFWNMTDKDIYAMPQAGRKDPHHLGNAFLKIVDQVGWVACDDRGNGGTPLNSSSPPLNIGPDTGEARNVVVDLTSGVFQGTASGAAVPEGVIFRAGACTVITTDPDGLPASHTNDGKTGGLNLATTYYCSKLLHGFRQYKGSLPTGKNGMKPRWRESDGEDYGTEVFLANSQGFLDSNPFALTSGGSAPVTATPTSSASTAKNPTDTIHGGSLFGNSTSPSQLGDPRTNNEQLSITRFISGSTGQPDQTRYFNQTSGFTLGFPNCAFCNPHTDQRWPDYYKGWDKSSSTPPAHRANPTAANAPMFVLNGPLQSIGQLGDVFDPARVKGSAGTLGVEASRGGGRTFKIGQQDDRIDPNSPTALSRQWASYRLADIFSVGNQVQLSGLINVNGIRRDNGAALRAACMGMTLRTLTQATDTSSTLSSADKALDIEETSTRGVQKLIALLKDRLTANDPGKGGDTSKYFGPLMERGELGDLPIFSIGSSLVTGVRMDDTFDRSREELTRRLIDLTTTRGSIFSVYALGQSISQGPAPEYRRSVTATHQVKVTFQLIPVWDRTDGSNRRVEKELWDPLDTKAVKDRFSKPSRYDVQILQVSY